MSPRAAARQSRELVEVLLLWLSPFRQVQFRSEDVAFLVLGLGRSPNVFLLFFCVSCGWFWLCPTGRLFRGCGRFAVLVPEKFFCVMVGFATGLTGLVNSSWFFVPSVICVVFLPNINIFAVLTVKSCKTTVAIIIPSTNFLLLSDWSLSLFWVDDIVHDSGLVFSQWWNVALGF